MMRHVPDEIWDVWAERVSRSDYAVSSEIVAQMRGLMDPIEEMMLLDETMKSLGADLGTLAGSSQQPDLDQDDSDTWVPESDDDGESITSSSDDDDVIINTEPREVRYVQEDIKRRIYSPETLMSLIPQKEEFFRLMSDIGMARVISVFDINMSNRTFERRYIREHKVPAPRELKVHKVLRKGDPDVVRRGTPYWRAVRETEKRKASPVICRFDSTGRTIPSYRIGPRRSANSCMRLIEPTTLKLKASATRKPRDIRLRGYFRMRDPKPLLDLIEESKQGLTYWSTRYLLKYKAFFENAGWYPVRNGVNRKSPLRDMRTHEGL
jgi:hypothetical protein